MSRKSAFVSKVLVPRLSGKTIRRNGLLSRLLSDDAPLTTVIAPAGYGKTTLLIDFANESPGTVSWLTLDDWDRDPIGFLMYLRASLAGGLTNAEHRRPDIAADTASLHERLGEIVAHATSGGDHRTLILDDFHFVEESEQVVDLVNYLIMRLPPQLRLIITSRRPLPFRSVPKFRLEGAISEYGVDDLAFDREEVVDFYRRRRRELSDVAVDRILDVTGGWPAGIALVSDPTGIDDSYRTNGLVADYVGAEVLRDLSPEVRDFLVHTSVLDALDPESCDALLERTGSIDLLDSIITSSVPLTHGGGPALELRIHPLVRNHLKSALRAEAPDLFRLLHLRAASRAESLGQQSEAVTHYIQGQDWDQAARLVQEQAPNFYRLGRWHTIAAWIREFPSAQLESYSGLRWWEARILVRLGEIDRALQVIGESSARMEDQTRLAEFESLKASALRTKGDVSGALAASRRAVELATADNAPIDVVAEARKELGLALMAEGAAEEAVAEFRAVLVLQERRGNTEEAAFVNGCLGSALGASGRLAESTEHLERSRQQWQIAGNTKELSWVLNNLGITYQRIGQPALATDVLVQCVTKSRQSGNRRAEAYALISLADIEIQTGDASAARVKYEAALDIATELGDHTALTHARCGLAIAFGKRGDPDRGITLARQALVSAQDRGSAYEEGVALVCLGRILRQRGDLEDAVSSLSGAAALFERTSATAELAQALLYLSDAALPVRSSRSLLRVSLERFARLADELGESVYSLVSASEVSRVLEYAASKRIGGGLFRDIARRAARSGDESAEEPSATRLPDIKIRALGAFEVEVGGRQVLSFEWESEKAREMFLLLAAKRQQSTRDEIISDLWPDAGGPRASSAFHSTLHRVRRATFREVIVESAGRYRLNPDVALVSDVEVFLTGINRALSGGLAELDRAALLKDALALYRGPFAPGLESEWAESFRRSLEEEFLSSSIQLARSLVDNGDYTTAVRTAERVLEIDPFNESACLLLMQAHAGGGDAESALRVYRRFSETLDLELGEVPGEGLTRLQAQIRAVAGKAPNSAL